MPRGIPEMGGPRKDTTLAAKRGDAAAGIDGSKAAYKDFVLYIIS